MAVTLRIFVHAAVLVGVVSQIGADFGAHGQDVYSGDNDVEFMVDSVASTSGTTYVRWGRTYCKSGSSLVYEGYMGGNRQGNSGSGGNYLCMTKTPKRTKGSLGTSTKWVGEIFGVELESDWPFSRSNNGDNSLVNSDLPCAVCETNGRSKMVMVPGTYSCPTGWTSEYSGYIASTHYGHSSPTEYVCLDGAPEVIPGGSSNRGHSTLYFTRSMTGSLPTPPYTDRREIDCVVCTK